jgi:hypothetical protein
MEQKHYEAMKSLMENPTQPPKDSVMWQWISYLSRPVGVSLLLLTVEEILKVDFTETTQVTFATYGL